MPRHCTVCFDTRRSEIEEALNEGATLRELAEQTGLSASAIHRHARNHLDKDTPIARPGVEMAELAARVGQLEQRLELLATVLLRIVEQ